MLTRCPYTLKPFSELPETSREHIILDALGGPNGYSVIACRIANNQLGQTVDAAFLAEPVVEALRAKVGVKSRSGIASWNLKGETVDGKRPVDVTFPHQGSVDIYHRKPVERDAQGKSFQIIAPPEQADKLLKDAKKNLAKKGIEISTVEVSQSESQEIHLPLVVNLTVMSAGLMKFAYLACCEFLGDKFLDDPLNSEWQKAIRAQSADDAKKIKIHGQCFDRATAHANILLPCLSEHEHGVAIVNLNQRGPVVVVRLFGNEMLTAVACVSETSDFDLPKGEGLLLICDSKKGMIRREQWSNHLLRMSRSSPNQI